VASRTASPKQRSRRTGERVLLSRRVLCVVSGISERQLALWEREELLTPAEIGKIDGRSEPLYDREAVRRVRVIRTLDEELEVNLPGIGVILHLLDQLAR
jgi:DNA-binding transcriptional MerR regulator